MEKKKILTYALIAAGAYIIAKKTGTLKGLTGLADDIADTIANAGSGGADVVPPYVPNYGGGYGGSPYMPAYGYQYPTSGGYGGSYYSQYSPYSPYGSYPGGVYNYSQGNGVTATPGYVYEYGQLVPADPSNPNYAAPGVVIANPPGTTPSPFPVTPMQIPSQTYLSASTSPGLYYYGELISAGGQMVLPGNYQVTGGTVQVVNENVGYGQQNPYPTQPYIPSQSVPNYAPPGMAYGTPTPQTGLQTTPGISASEAAREQYIIAGLQSGILQVSTCGAVRPKQSQYHNCKFTTQTSRGNKTVNFATAANLAKRAGVNTSSLYNGASIGMVPAVSNY